ncbi:NTE family protein [Thermocatellispora tengchongensis]|uniref:NTE family protein n=1 Tax=Thermocatellispora tengchongensis TaxID=1073253 RepID=A0A840P5W1_9ACTN|nr:patatin-like phospholipase family protein [Thermocatellispora tengchongensis]MBB5132860.1 NTE family protein [Thermocatellispora tengchongensis]
MTKALVLGGGGIAGIAWEAGVVTGLRRAGVDLGEAEVFVGTSAGSVVSAMLATGADLEDAITHLVATDRSSPPSVDMDTVMAAFAVLADTALDPAEARRRVGAMAMAAPVSGEAERLAAIGERLPVKEWPAGRLLITAVDVETGELVIWDREAGVPLVSAVASSCAVPCVFPPVRIDGRHYMDGGVRSITNADLAAGCSPVVIMSPMAAMTPPEPLRSEIETLVTDDVSVIAPDENAVAVFGVNVLDPALWQPAFEAGLAQAPALADDVAKIWNR